MIERKKAREIPPTIPAVPADIIQVVFDRFWVAILVAGKEESVGNSNFMEDTQPKLYEIIKALSLIFDKDDALEFERGAHFVHQVLSNGTLLGRLRVRVRTIKRFWEEMDRYSRQFVSVDNDLYADSEDFEIRYAKVKEKLVSDFSFPFPANFAGENAFLMQFIHTRGPYFATGGSFVYKLYDLELVSRRLEKMGLASKVQSKK